MRETFVAASQAGSPPSDFGPGRVCEALGCVTTLSRYTRGRACSRHSLAASIARHPRWARDEGAQDWYPRAACRTTKLDFHALPEDDPSHYDKEHLDLLTVVCGRCPVARECAEFSVRDSGVEPHGVWAGSLPRRRAALSREWPDPARVLLADLGRNEAASRARIRRAEDRRRAKERRASA